MLLKGGSYSQVSSSWIRAADSIGLMKGVCNTVDPEPPFWDPCSVAALMVAYWNKSWTACAFSGDEASLFFPQSCGAAGAWARPACPRASSLGALVSYWGSTSAAQERWQAGKGCMGCQSDCRVVQKLEINSCNYHSLGMLCFLDSL